MLWLDAHADFNTPSTTLTGNLNGMVLAMLCGAFGSAAMFGITDFPPLDAEKLLLVGTRAVDAMEGVHMRDYNLNVVHAGDVSSNAFASNLGRHLNGIRRAGGVLHVSLDLDVLDPVAAPGVATPVPGGCQLGDVMVIMKLLAATDCVGSLDVVEFVPEADPNGKTANAAVALATTLFGAPRQRRPATAAQSAMEAESG